MRGVCIWRMYHILPAGAMGIGPPPTQRRHLGVAQACGTLAVRRWLWWLLACRAEAPTATPARHWPGAAEQAGDRGRTRRLCVASVAPARAESLAVSRGLPGLGRTSLLAGGARHPTPSVAPTPCHLFPPSDFASALASASSASDLAGPAAVPALAKRPARLAAPSLRRASCTKHQAPAARIYTSPRFPSALAPRPFCLAQHTPPASSSAGPRTCIPPYPLAHSCPLPRSPQVHHRIRFLSSVFLASDILFFTMVSLTKLALLATSIAALAHAGRPAGQRSHRRAAMMQVRGSDSGSDSGSGSGSGSASSSGSSTSGSGSGKGSSGGSFSGRATFFSVGLGA